MSQVIMHDYGKFPDGMSNQYGTIDTLGELDIGRLQGAGIDEAWYWYASGSYEGSGQILMRKDNLYDVHNMGHCSCYGPIDYMEFIGKSLGEVERLSSEEYRAEIAPLIQMARGDRGING